MTPRIEEIPSDQPAINTHNDPPKELSPEELKASIDKELKEQGTLPYSWKQTLEDVTISISLPPNTRGKDLAITIGKQKISVALKSKISEPFIVGDLFGEIHPDESTWTVVDQKELTITLEKVSQSEWWPHVVTTAPKIDVKRIEPETSKLSDLDGETRAMVEKMMVCIYKFLYNLTIIYST